mmetsp:Transcript_13408/g.31788  ORF Transcript_13408/g.31788 Transcript_13408/m.31788 type:complete len:346 (+) Transcript_13408:810-1847(+)
MPQPSTDAVAATSAAIRPSAVSSAADTSPRSPSLRRQSGLVQQSRHFGSVVGLEFVHQQFERSAGGQDGAQVVQSQHDEEGPRGPLVEMRQLPRQNDTGHDQVSLRHLGGDAALVEDAGSADDGKVPQCKKEGELVNGQTVDLHGRVEHHAAQEAQQHGRAEDHVPDEALHAPVLVQEDDAEGHEANDGANDERIEEGEGGVLGGALVGPADGEDGVGLRELRLAHGQGGLVVDVDRGQCRQYHGEADWLGDGVIRGCAVHQLREGHAGVLLRLAPSCSCRGTAIILRTICHRGRSCCSVVAVVGISRALRLVRDGVVPLPGTAGRGGVGTAGERRRGGGHDGIA